MDESELDGAFSVARFLNESEESSQRARRGSEDMKHTVKVDASGRVTDSFLRALDEEEQSMGNASPFTANFHPRKEREGWRRASSKMLRVEDELEEKYAPITELIQLKKKERSERQQYQNDQLYTQQSTHFQEQQVNPSKEKRNFAAPTFKQHPGSSRNGQYNKLDQKFEANFSTASGKTIGDAAAAATFTVISGKADSDQGYYYRNTDSDEKEEVLSLDNEPRRMRHKKRGRQRSGGAGFFADALDPFLRSNSRPLRKSRSLSCSHPNQNATPLKSSTLASAQATNTRMIAEDYKEALASCRREAEAKIKKLQLRIEGQVRAIRSLEFQISELSVKIEVLVAENTKLKQTVKTSRLTTQDVVFLREARETLAAQKKREEDLQVHVSEYQRLLKECRQREKKAKESRMEEKRSKLQSQKDFEVLQAEALMLQRKLHTMKNELEESRKEAKTKMTARVAERQRRLAADLVEEREAHQREVQRLKSHIAEIEAERVARAEGEAAAKGLAAELGGRLRAVMDENSNLRDRLAVTEMKMRAAAARMNSPSRPHHRSASPVVFKTETIQISPEDSHNYFGRTMEDSTSTVSEPIFHSSSARNFGALVEKKDRMRSMVKRHTAHGATSSNHQLSKRKGRKEAQQNKLLGGPDHSDEIPASPTALTLVDQMKRRLLNTRGRNTQTDSQRSRSTSLGNTHSSPTSQPSADSKKYDKLKSMYNRVYKTRTENQDRL